MITRYTAHIFPIFESWLSSLKEEADKGRWPTLKSDAFELRRDVFSVGIYVYHMDDYGILRHFVTLNYYSKFLNYGFDDSINGMLSCEFNLHQMGDLEKEREVLALKDSEESKLFKDYELDRFQYRRKRCSIDNAYATFVNLLDRLNDMKEWHFLPSLTTHVDCIEPDLEEELIAEEYQEWSEAIALYLLKKLKAQAKGKRWNGIMPNNFDYRTKYLKTYLDDYETPAALIFVVPDVLQVEFVSHTVRGWEEDIEPGIRIEFSIYTLKEFDSVAYEFEQVFSKLKPVINRGLLELFPHCKFNWIEPLKLSAELDGDIDELCEIFPRFLDFMLSQRLDYSIEVTPEMEEIKNEMSEKLGFQLSLQTECSQLRNQIEAGYFVQYSSWDDEYTGIGEDHNLDKDYFESQDSVSNNKDIN